MSVKAKIELRCQRDLEVSSEIHCQAVLMLPDQPEQVLREQTLESEDQLAWVAGWGCGRHGAESAATA